MTYYWLAGVSLADGSIVHAGNWGRVVRAYGYRHGSAARELQFELVRREVRPAAPSRLDAAFVSTELAAAEAFMASYRATDCLYEVELTDPTAPQFVADMECWNQVGQLPQNPTGWSELALAESYWSGCDSGLLTAELLTLSDLQVLSRFR